MNNIKQNAVLTVDTEKLKKRNNMARKAFGVSTFKKEGRRKKRKSRHSKQHKGLKKSERGQGYPR